MSKVCKSNYIIDSRRPARATYVSLHRWAEPEEEGAESVRWSGFGRGPVAVDGVSCRQMYLRSYKFSKKETMPEKMRKCLMQAREKVVGLEWNGEMVKMYGKRKCDVMLRKMRGVSFAAFFRVFWRLLSGAAPVDVVKGKR